MNNVLLKEIVTRHRDKILKPYDVMLDLDGFDAIMAFSEHLSGCTTYVPSVKKIFISCIEQAAINDFEKGNKNYGQLARKYDLSERHLRRVISGK